MFVDFNKVFGKTPQTELKIPQALIDQLSSKLPDGFIYVVDEKNNTINIKHNGDKDVIVSGMMLNPTDKQLEDLGENWTFNDAMAYSYNSQQSIPVKLAKEGYININGEDVPINHLSYNPFKPYSIKANSTRMCPSTFPPSFPLFIGCDDIKIELQVKRIPNNSISTVSFESDKNRCLYVKYYYNPKSNAFSINLNVFIDNAQTIKEIVDSIKVYNAFIDGKGVLADIPINEKVQSNIAKKYNEETLEFWEKVYELENKIGESFNPKDVDLDYDFICAFERVYQSIVNHAPVRSNRTINTITSKWEFTKDKVVEESLGKPIYFEFEGMASVELFKCKLDLPCIVGIFNAILSDYKKDELNEECTLFLENESDRKTMYTSELCFLNEEELKKYREEKKDRILILRDAKKINEYLKKDNG